MYRVTQNGNFISGCYCPLILSYGARTFKTPIKFLLAVYISRNLGIKLSGPTRTSPISFLII